MEKMLSLLVWVGLLAVFVIAGQAVKEPLIVKEPIRNDGFPNDDECVHRANITGYCLSMGMSHRYDTLVYEGDEDKIGIPFYKREGEFKFRLHESRYRFVISSIKVYNRMKPDVQGTVTLTKGGIAHSFIELLFQSQTGEGYQFAITIYAVPTMNEQGNIYPPPEVNYVPHHKSEDLPEDPAEELPVEFPQTIPIDFPRKVQEIYEEKGEVFVPPIYEQNL